MTNWRASFFPPIVPALLRTSSDLRQRRVRFFLNFEIAIAEFPADLKKKKEETKKIHEHFRFIFPVPTVSFVYNHMPTANVYLYERP